jgi:hypothetical protein
MGGFISALLGYLFFLYNEVSQYQYIQITNEIEVNSFHGCFYYWHPFFIEGGVDEYGYICLGFEVL